MYTFVGRDSSVGIAIRYGLDSSGIEFRWKQGFPQPSRQAMGPTQPPPSHNAYRVTFQGVKQPGRGVNHPPSSSAEVKERVELYLYSTLGLHCLF
jgi:hypothetical protein